MNIIRHTEGAPGYAMVRAQAKVMGRKRVLSKREFEVLNWMAAGKTASEIGRILGIAKRTVQFHQDKIRSSLNAATLPAAIHLAHCHGLLSRDPAPSSP